jgi:hypothetical protein
VRTVLLIGAVTAATAPFVMAEATPPPPPTLVGIFSDTFESPVTDALTTTPLSGDTQWQSSKSGYILNNFSNPNSTNQTQILGFGQRSGGGDALSVPVPIAAGHDYNLSTMYATDGDDGFLGVQQFDVNGVYLGEQWVLGGVQAPNGGQLGMLPNSNQWATYAHDFTPVANTVHVVIEVEDYDQSGNPTSYGPSAYFDNITLSAYDNVPVANNVSASTTENVPVTAALSATDADSSDSLTYAITSQPAHGQVTVSGSNFTYTPNAGYYNTSATKDTFVYSATDGLGQAGSAVGSVLVIANSRLAYTGASQGVYTNSKVSVVQQAQLSSDNPFCLPGRTVTFTLTGPAPATTQRVLTGITSNSGAASAKYANLPTGVYNVTVSAPAVPNLCTAPANGTGTWSFNQPKK